MERWCQKREKSRAKHRTVVPKERPYPFNGHIQLFRASYVVDDMIQRGGDRTCSVEKDQRQHAAFP